MQLLLAPWDLQLLLDLQAASTHIVARRRLTTQPTIWRAYRRIVRRLQTACPGVRLELLAKRPRQSAFTDLDQIDRKELLDNGLEFETVINRQPGRVAASLRGAYQRAAKQGE